MYIVFEIKSVPFYTDKCFTLRGFLFGAVKLSKDPHLDKYSYSGYGISFDVRGRNFFIVESWGVW